MRKAATVLVCGLVLTGLVCGVSQAVIVPFSIFTSDGLYHDNPGINLYVDVYNGEGNAKFRFFNASSIDCSIARIFFDDGSLLGIDYVLNDTTPGHRVEFSRCYPGPGNLPGGDTLNPPFRAWKEFNIGAEQPPPENGINSIPTGEWVEIKFELLNGHSLTNVLQELQTGELRIGLHVIAFPDGSSESAINNPVPEPTTIALLALGGFALLRKRYS